MEKSNSVRLIINKVQSLESGRTGTGKCGPRPLLKWPAGCLDTKLNLVHRYYYTRKNVTKFGPLTLLHAGLEKVQMKTGKHHEISTE